MRRSAIVAACIGLLLTMSPAVAAAPGAAAAPSLTDDVALELVIGGRTFLIAVDAPVGDDRLFFAEKAGRIRIIEDGSLVAPAFLDISGRIDSGANERGLLGLAFHPDYEETGTFYVNYTRASDGDTVISEFTVSGDRNVADAGSERVLLRANQPANNHNGGSLAFDRDGYLLVALGDGGGGGDPWENGQNKNTVLGAILRIDTDGNPAPDNPFVGAAGDDRIWAWGLRNPWRISVDARNGDIWVGDVGQNAREEVDRIPYGEGGLNFGWNTREGDRCFDPPSNCASAGLTPPVYDYAHGADPCSGSITGGYVYRGNDIPKLRGHYFFADYCTLRFQSFRLSGGEVRDLTSWRGPLGFESRILSFGTDGFGELYVVTFSSIYKLVSEAVHPCDFNGDGYEDVATGVPGESAAGAPESGAVHVFYGSANGLDATADQFITQDTPGVVGTSEPGDQFGYSVTCGNFDGDGYGDLAIGAPHEKISGKKEAGAVTIIAGSPSGLDPNRSRLVHQSKDGIRNKVEKLDRFGYSLAAGDVNRDGRDDLVVGVPGEKTGGVRGGAVAVIRGAPSLTTDVGDVIFTGEDEAAQLGAAVVAGDFNGDGWSDVAAGEPGEGRVIIFNGSAGGPAPASVVGPEGALGSVLAAGATDADGFDDLAATKGDGTVIVYRGRRSGFSGGKEVRQGVGGVAGKDEPNDDFGSGLAIGDVDGDRFGDLLIGVGGERLGGQAAGSAHLLFGTVLGIKNAGDELIKPGSGGLPGSRSDYGALGSAVGVFDVDGDGDADLVLGDPAAGGQLLVVPAAGGADQSSGELIDQDTPGVLNKRESSDRFGGAL